MSKLAIAYSMKKKKMADGGMIKHDSDKAKQISDSFKSVFSKGGEVKGVHQSSMGVAKPMDKKEKKWAGESMAGQDMRNADLNDSSMMHAKAEHHKILGELMAMKKAKLQGMAEGGEADMVDRIMAKKYSEGGQVANDCDEYADEMPNEFDDLVLDDDLEFNYTGANSGDELGDEQEDEDRKDIVARIMASRKKKDKLPNPA